MTEILNGDRLRQIEPSWGQINADVIINVRLKVENMIYRIPHTRDTLADIIALDVESSRREWYV